MSYIEKNAARQELLKEFIGIRFNPIALKFVKSEDEVPETAVRPSRDMGEHIALCHAFALARRKNKTVFMTKYDHWCWNPILTYGLVPFVPGSKELNLITSMMGITDQKKADEFVNAFPRIPYGEYIGTVVAPLKDADFEPDVTLIYMRNNMLTSVLMAINSQTGSMLESSFAPLDSCCYGVIPPLQEGKYAITIPDPGERCRAAVEADAIIVTVPHQRADEFWAGIDLQNKAGFTPEYLVPELTGDYAVPPFYNTLFEAWGLPTGKVWDQNKG